MKLLYILNPVAGGRDNRFTSIEEIKEILAGVDLRVFKTTGKDDLPAVKQIISEGTWDGLLIGGGDGTVNMVAQAIGDSRIPLGIMPLGSANGMAACLGIYQAEDTLYSIKHKRKKAIDALSINGKLCLHLADFGFNAALIRKYDEGNRRGMLGYFKSSLEEFLLSKPYSFVVDAGEHQHHVEAKMLVIANGERYGTQAIINPGSQMDDGEMEIVVLNPTGFDDLLRISLALFRGNLDEQQAVKIFKVQKAEIQNLDNADFQIDGEVIKDSPKATAICHKGKFDFFVPSKK